MKTTNTKLKILIVEDQVEFSEAMKMEFAFLGHEAETANNGKLAYDLLLQNKYDLIISDIRMPQWDGIKLLDEFRKISPTAPPFFLMSGFADISMQEAFAKGADAFLGKPMDLQDLENIVKKACLPPEKRWALKPEEKLKLQFSEENSTVNLGRGGMFLSMHPVLSVLRQGHLFGFSLNLGKEFKNPCAGIGRVRWTRFQDQDSLKAGVGVLFEYLDDLCRDEIAGYISKQGQAATIPLNI